MKNPCNNCNNFIKDSEYTTKQCRWCWLQYHTTLYNNNPSPTGKPMTIALPCIHQGDVKYRAKCACPRKDTYVCEVGLGENGFCVPVIHCGPTTCPKYEADTI